MAAPFERGSSRRRDRFAPRRGGFTRAGGGYVVRPHDFSGEAPLPAAGPGLPLRIPLTLDELNGIHAAWFSHAWNFEASSGSEADYATEGAIPLVPQGTVAPAQGVSTGLANSDKGVQLGDNTNQRMEAGASGDLDVTTGGVVMLGTTRLLLATSGRAIVAKYNGAVYYRLLTAGTGHLQWSVSDGTNARVLTADVDHSGEAYVDWAVGRAGGEVGLVTSLHELVKDTDTTVNLTNTGRFCAGRNFGSASSIHTFLGWGTGLDDVDNLPAMLAAYRAYRGAA